jgi:hypothetical protein
LRPKPRPLPRRSVGEKSKWSVPDSPPN